MTKPNVYFWQPLLTDHAIFTYKAVAESLGLQAKCISDRAEMGIRREQGWTAVTEILPVETLPINDWREQIQAIIARCPDDIHVFGSPFEKSRINYALRLAYSKKRSVFLISEPYSPVSFGYFHDRLPAYDWLKSKLRPVVYYLRGLKYAGSIDGVFAISPLAVQQFKSFGIKKERIFPFGYFVPNLDPQIPAIDRPSSQVLRTAYVGSLIKRKGVHTAIRAIERIGPSVATLDIFGPGSSAAFGQTPNNVTFQGSIPFGTAQDVLRGYDLLIVPSQHDGWAVVVNEAIMAGVPVIVTRQTGASALISRWQCGATFQAGDSEALSEILCDLAAAPDLLAFAKSQSRLLSPLLEPKVAGDYMARCIIATINDRVAPQNPWY